MTELTRECSPDGQLILRVEQYLEADGTVGIALGFEGAPWHIHPPPHIDPGETGAQWAMGVVDDIVSNRMLIVTCREGDFVETRLADPLEFEIDYKSADETLEFRFWNGQTVAIDDLIDGKVIYKVLPPY